MKSVKSLFETLINEMEDDYKFLELANIIVEKKKDDLTFKRIRSYIISYLLVSVLLVLLKPGVVVSLIYFILTIVLAITLIVIRKEVTKEVSNKLMDIAKELKENEDKTFSQTDILYNIWSL